MPSEEQLVVAVEHILAGEDVQTFNIKALMLRLSACFLSVLSPQP